MFEVFDSIAYHSELSGKGHGIAAESVNKDQTPYPSPFHRNILSILLMDDYT